MQREDEAKAKWCPFARTRMFGASDVTANRSLPGTSLDRRASMEAATRCLGSDCAVWEPLGQYLDNGNSYGRCGLTQPSS